MSDVVSWLEEGGIAFVTIDNPPVNALSKAVREGLLDIFTLLRHKPSIAGVVLQCAGRTFVAGADIKEFSSGNPVECDPNEVHLAVENLGKPVVAAIHGTALGGGLELALSCHYRVADGSAKVGLPEVTLGVVPGAGGTQRSVRLMGIQAALDLMLSGAPISSEKALAAGLVDKVVSGNLRAEAKAFLENVIAEDKPLPRASDLPVALAAEGQVDFQAMRAEAARKARSPYAATRIIDCGEAATRKTFDEALAFERAQFLDCLASPEAVALQHVFFVEREAARIPNQPKDTALRRIDKVGIVGAGTMGGGIAMTFINAGIPVALLEVRQDALDRGIGTIRKNYEITAAKGKLTAEQFEARMALLTGTMDYASLADCDLVIEAVFENMEIKKGVLATLDGVCKPGAIIATNTSTLDVDDLAAVTGRPQDVLGMHFFSPANVMRLLEVVRGARTSPDVLATVMSLAKRIGKVAVVSGVCYGFIGNRMLEGYLREAELLLLEGASPQQVDRALEGFGMAMGPHRMMDMAGVDVGAKVLIERWKSGGMPDDPAYRAAVQTLNERGRHGQKTGAGYYRYEGRTPVPDPELAEIFSALAVRHGVARRDNIADEEIVMRCLYPLFNEGAKILEEGIAYRAGDIDVVWTSGYGFPARKGGPMHQADVIGALAIVEGLAQFARRYGNDHGYWTPSVLLVRLAESGGRFADI